jgi:hypothetical protein
MGLLQPKPNCPLKPNPPLWVLVGVAVCANKMIIITMYHGHWNYPCQNQTILAKTKSSLLGGRGGGSMCLRDDYYL